MRDMHTLNPNVGFRVSLGGCLSPHYPRSVWSIPTTNETQLGSRVERGVGEVEWVTRYGWLSKLWSLFWIPVIVRHLILRVPEKGP